MEQDSVPSLGHLPSPKPPIWENQKENGLSTHHVFLQPLKWNQQLQVISCRISRLPKPSEESYSRLVIVSTIQLSPWALWGKALSSEQTEPFGNSFKLKGVGVEVGGTSLPHPTLQLCRKKIPCAPARGGLLGLRHGTPTCPGGRLLILGTCSCPGRHHRVTKLHYPNETLTRERSCPQLHPTPLAGTQNKRT